MITRSIQNPARFEILDEVSQNVCLGGNQEWYKTQWQRLSGCGPTTATNILYYLACKHGCRTSGESPITRNDYLALMEQIWEYVTPTIRGIPSAKLLGKGVDHYIKAKGLDIVTELLHIPRSGLLRPPLRQVLAFVDEALRNDTPVAFLNLNNGEEKKLDSWHWVTVISLEYEEEGNTAFMEILDNGVLKKIDFALWFRSTKLGGGFVRFHMANRAQGN